MLPDDEYTPVPPSFDVFIYRRERAPGHRAETFGLAEHGLPELEVTDVRPAFLLAAAAALLDDLGHYMLDRGQALKPGETVRVGPGVTVALEQADPEHGDRLRVVALDPHRCPLCESADHDLWSGPQPRPDGAEPPPGCSKGSNGQRPRGQPN